MPKMKEIIKISFKSVAKRINPRNRSCCYEIFGYDFIIDVNMKPFLLEVNTNPGLEESSPLIKKLVPRMLEDSLRLTFNNVFELNNEDAFTSVDGYSDQENIFDYIGKL